MGRLQLDGVAEGLGELVSAAAGSGGPGGLAQLLERTGCRAGESVDEWGLHQEWRVQDVHGKNTAAAAWRGSALCAIEQAKEAAGRVAPS